MQVMYTLSWLSCLKSLVKKHLQSLEYFKKFCHVNARKACTVVVLKGILLIHYKDLKYDEQPD